MDKRIAKFEKVVVAATYIEMKIEARFTCAIKMILCKGVGEGGGRQRNINKHLLKM